MSQAAALLRFDADYVARTANEIGEAIDRAAFDPSGWDTVVERFASAFPGAFASLQSVDLVEHHLNFEATYGLDPDFLRSYRDYYITINPWVDRLMQFESGRVIVAEKDCPARHYAHTEFYNDWLIRLNDAEGAAGLKLDAGPRDLVFLPIHYPHALTATYDAPLAEVLLRVRGNILRASEHARLFAKHVEREKSAAALVNRAPDIAFVVDQSTRLCDANEAALSAMRSGTIIRCVVGRVHLASTTVQRWLEAVLHNLSRDRPVDSRAMAFRVGDGVYRISVIHIPETAPEYRRILAPRNRLFLVSVRHLNGGRAPSGLSLLATAYDLTPSEIRMCQHLAAGQTIAETAILLGITNETARQRIKGIFQKTGTHRQSELVALLLRTE